MNLHGVRNLTDVVVPQNIAVSTGLLQDSVGDDVAAFEFFNETLAFLDADEETGTGEGNGTENSGDNESGVE